MGILTRLGIRRIQALKGSVALLLPAKRLSLLIVLAVAPLTPPLAGQLAPATTGGVGELDRILQRLAQPTRVLMVGAHPDDEDTSLLSLMARGFGAEVAYLSLSRGEGGQNLIGTELGESLGLLRSQELVSARSVDGARQFFTRAFDFGYTRSVEEANEHWPPDSILKDVVRIVRRFKPHVIVSVFSGTPRDGHGQHQAAGIAAHRAFDLAGDENVFPELASEENLASWTPQKLYRSTRFDTSEASLQLPTGGLDQRVGRTFYQIAMESRSRHRSQDMGRSQPIGPNRASVRLVESRTGMDDGFFSGIDVPVSRVSRIADSLRSALSPSNPSRVVSGLLDAFRQAETDDERALLGEAAAIAAGLVMDATTTVGEIVPGQTVEVEVSAYNAGPMTVESLDLEVYGPNGWETRPADDWANDRLPSGKMATRSIVLEIPIDASPTQPYFLAAKRRGALYDWDRVPSEVKGLPFQPPGVMAHVRAEIMGVTIAMSREVTYRTSEQALGEVRKPLLVRPRVSVAVAPDQLIWPSGSDNQRSFTVTAKHFGSEPYRGQVEIVVPGWEVSPSQRFSFRSFGEETSFSFDVKVPASTTEASVVLQAIARGDDGVVHRSGIKSVEYPHIRSVSWVDPAESRIVLAPIALPPVSRVGYIRGAADRVPEALAGVGLPVEMLDEEQLAKGDLSQFDVIVVGSRAYETDSALTAHNDRLLEYVRSGGHLVVQYQQYAFVRGAYAPYPLTINRPHDRITDETAPVRVIDPSNPIFGRPNTIIASDWDGWPQERGLYFPGTWDEAYQPVLEMNDPGREPLQGALLVAPYGNGTYVYTGLSFFRALPAGVPGAYKLFFNILSVRPDNVP